MNPRIEELEDILDALLKGIQEALQSGETLPEELQLAVAQEINELTTEIDQLYSLQDQQQQAPAPSIEAPVSNDAQLLWILSGQQPQAFISYLRTFPTAATQSLLNNPEQLNATIVQLQQTMPQGAQPVVDGIEKADLNSSNVWGAAYNPRTGKLKVRFQGGSEYEYDGVPKAIFDAFIHGNATAKTKGKNKYGEYWPGKNPSLGAALNQYIKAGNFPYKKIK